jgi:hypothetical protein
MNPLFDVWSPDEVAECLGGVGHDLYRRLWELVELVPPNGETPDTCFERALSKVWDKLDAYEQAELNRLAEAQELQLERE